MEAAICASEPFSNVIYEAGKDVWDNLKVKKESLKRERETQRIPAVCVCVQGGPGTIETVSCCNVLGEIAVRLAW